MQIEDILAALEAEIQRLRDARSLLVGESVTKRRGRPPGSGAAIPGSTQKRTLSAEAREKIAAAQRRRWAKVKKA